MTLRFLDRRGKVINAKDLLTPCAIPKIIVSLTRNLNLSKGKSLAGENIFSNNQIKFYIFF